MLAPLRKVNNFFSEAFQQLLYPANSKLGSSSEDLGPLRKTPGATPGEMELDKIKESEKKGDLQGIQENDLAFISKLNTRKKFHPQKH